jgi:hypothetical protein
MDAQINCLDIQTTRVDAHTACKDIQTTCSVVVTNRIHFLTGNILMTISLNYITITYDAVASNYSVFSLMII